MEERIVGPDPVTDPGGYTAALMELLGERDPVDVIAATPTELVHSTAALSEPALQAAPAPGEWSVEELIAHLFHAEVVYAFRWRLTLRQPGTSYPGYDQDAWTDLARPPFPELLESFATLRRANVALIRGTPEEEWTKECLHEERGPESFARAVALIAGHDIAHLKQLEQTVATVGGG